MHHHGDGPTSVNCFDNENDEKRSKSANEERCESHADQQLFHFQRKKTCHAASNLKEKTEISNVPCGVLIGLLILDCRRLI